jgi:23S rRNA pseudouridine955/2504/2580 synthase
MYSLSVYHICFFYPFFALSGVVVSGHGFHYNTSMSLLLTAAADDNGRRLDRVLRKAAPDLPLSALHRLLRKGRIFLDGKPSNAAARVKTGQVIEIVSFADGAAPFRLSTGSEPFIPAACPIIDVPPLPPVLFEGEGLLVLNKPPGFLVHGEGSLEELVRLYLKPRLPPSLSFKPGPLHRLDRPTSGIIVFSTSLEGARRFSALIRERKLRKEYLAITDGIIQGTWNTWIDKLVRDREVKKTLAPGAGEKRFREAVSRVRPLAAAGDHTLILAEIETGRTHQIRAQAAARGHPLSGDRKYGGSPLSGGFCLHARALEFPDRTDETAFPGLPRRIEAPLPEGFRMKTKEFFGAETLDILNSYSKFNH